MTRNYGQYGVNWEAAATGDPLPDQPSRAVTRIRLKRFTAFEELDFAPSPGINVLTGANGTGKTHLMKVAYAACYISKTKDNFAEKLNRLFLPSGRRIGRLVRRRQGQPRCEVEVHRDPVKIRTSFTGRTDTTRAIRNIGAKDWCKHPMESIYIPVKEMLANAPGFRSLYGQREIHFEEIYADIIDRAYLPIQRGRPDIIRERLLQKLLQAMDGTVVTKGEEFFLRKRGDLEFTLLAEGIRKLGLLYLLIQNGSLSEGSILFWDEPETNLNPKLFKPVINILLELQSMGIQIFLATHDYVILKELDLQSESTAEVVYHSLYLKNSEIKLHTTDNYLNLHENVIMDTFDSLYDQAIKQSVLP